MWWIILGTSSVTIFFRCLIASVLFNWLLRTIAWTEGRFLFSVYCWGNWGWKRWVFVQSHRATKQSGGRWFASSSSSPKPFSSIILLCMSARKLRFRNLVRFLKNDLLNFFGSPYFYFPKEIIIKFLTFKWSLCLALKCQKLWKLGTLSLSVVIVTI